jgi:uncharacterized protein (UPF0332 family)
MQQAQTYQERSREYLSKAFQELADGDLTQASEKGWGAAAQMVKAVANERGQRHSQHRDVLGMAQALARETGNRDMEIEFALARELHSNFYEDTLDHEEVEWRLQRVEQFVNRVECLLH